MTAAWLSNAAIRRPQAPGGSDIGLPLDRDAVRIAVAALTSRAARSAPPCMQGDLQRGVFRARLLAGEGFSTWLRIERTALGGADVAA
jgi:hypothetical protein